jgi:dinuclear metal center YbgI/SA1388 family protein
MTTSLAEIERYTDELLESAQTPDYPHALNGLQLQNSGDVLSIAGAVDFSMRTIEGAISTGSDLLVVHHGMFWNGLEALTGPAFRRVRTALDGNLAVYSSHLPLDRHKRLGNNVLLAQELGLEPDGEFARFGEIFIGVKGQSDLDTTTLIERASNFSRKHHGETRVTLCSKGRKTRRWAICTGMGATSETIREANTSGIDTLIVGEGAHHTAVEAEESGLVIIYAGHYATETLGVSALAQHLGDKFGLPWHFVSAPTGL